MHSLRKGDYYALRGEIVGGERWLKELDERLEMWAQYEKYRPIRRQLDRAKPGRCELFREKHSADLSLYEAAARYLEKLNGTGEAITPKLWQAEADKLAAQKEVQYQQMRSMRDQIKAVENLKKQPSSLPGANR